MVEAVSALEYVGNVQPKTTEGSSYLPSRDLVEAVNLAIYLQRPLLLKGEPGCGKTQLASAVAFELGLPLESWYVKSTSPARDGLYTYDAVGRLRDAQLAGSGRLTDEQIRQADDPASYIRWGPLGRAFLSQQRTVVLIDEIDKADIDFPNDLLLELDKQEFLVEETGATITARIPPIVFITSNDEKDLPDAFLRRCLFHFVEFPAHDRLLQILRSRFPTTPEELVTQAVARFLELREAMKREKGGSGKKVSTSELIDWVQVLRRYPKDEALGHLGGQLPFPGVLLKSWEDHIRFLRVGNRG